MYYNILLCKRHFFFSIKIDIVCTLSIFHTHTSGVKSSSCPTVTTIFLVLS